MAVTRAMVAAQGKAQGLEQAINDKSMTQLGVAPPPRTASNNSGSPRKQIRKNKAPTRGVRGRGKLSLKRILDLPPEVFNEIALYLMPADLLSLARSTKFFRNIFMSHSSRQLWRKAIGNVEDLPTCPRDLSEPQYVSLIYSDTCSACGTRVQRRMDPYIRVRLCAACRRELVRELPRDDPRVELLRTSQTERYSFYCLNKELEEVDRILGTLELKSPSELQAWKAQRQKEIKEQYYESIRLEDFLCQMHEVRAYELETLKDKRQEDIEKHLIEKGWAQTAFKCAPQNRAAWSHLVHQPKPLTDRIWNNIYPKLVPLLETNRAYNEEKCRNDRLAKRQSRVHDLFSQIRFSFPPLVRMKAVWTKPGSGPAGASIYDDPIQPHINIISMPFPTTAELLTWPIVKEMVENDTSVEELEEKFKERRGDIDQALSSWKEKVLRDVLDIWRKGSEEKPSQATSGGTKGKQKATQSSARQAKDVPPAQDKTPRMLRKGKERVLSSPELTCGTSLPPFELTFTKPDGTTTDNVEELPDGLRLLFRADALFNDEGLSKYYPRLLPGHHNSYICTDDGLIPDYGEIWDPTEFRRDEHGSTVARTLLEIMGSPDATHPEMRALGDAFWCQRCSGRHPDSWEMIVYHFASENARYNEAQTKTKGSSGSKFAFYNAHDLSPSNTKPVFKILSPLESSNVWDELTGYRYS